MQALTSSQLLRVWEEGMGQPLLDKTCRLIGTACHTIEYSSISKLSIGERDARLLLLREWMFGTHLHNMAKCPACGETTEWESNTTQLHLQPLPQQLSVHTFNVEKDGYAVTFRLPDSNDIAKALKEPDNEQTNRNILLACVIDASHNGKDIDGSYLPEAMLEQLSLLMAEHDPQADIRMAIKCPSCQHQWDAQFDIMSFLWAEINNWAQRMLREIYLLAKNFGWHEADILNMHPRRRQIYLQLLGA